MNGMAAHAYRLDERQRSDGVVARGEVADIHRRLVDGHPITVLAVGASVAVQAGCIDQPGAECMKYSGHEYVDLGWGRGGRHEGFLVQWFNWMNRTWPHPGHRLINKAGNGVALQTILPCLFGALPARIDLVVLEVGSLAKWLTPSSIELAVRKFRGLPHAPAVLFVTVPLWYAPGVIASQDSATRSACQARYSQNDFRMSGGNWGAQLSGSEAGPRQHTYWSRTEQEVDLVCAHYGQASISVYRALAPAVRAHRRGFSLADVARDCVHPMHGRYGSEYVADLMIAWLSSAAVQGAPTTTRHSTESPS